MNNNEVIDFFPYFQKITQEEKKTMAKQAKELSLNMFDRQGEFNNIKNNQENSKKIKAFKDRAFKIYLGMMAEKLFQKYLLENFNSTLLQNIVFDGFSKDQNNKADEFDLKINNLTIDIKSSTENFNSFEKLKNKNFNGSYVDFCLEKRNFTLPIDQKPKDVIIQIMFLFEDETKTKLKEVYCFGGITKEELLKKENIRNLKLNNGNYQKTYMTKLKNGKKLEEIINFNPTNNLNLQEENKKTIQIKNKFKK